MEIGSIIRSCRRAKDMTQEELAELLNLSVSAVSQWECGKNLPDITVIPALCSVLDMTADRLLGIDSAKKEERIGEIVTEAFRYRDRGYLDESLKILTAGLNKYPDSWSLITQLMHTHYLKYTTNHDNKADLEKAVRYGERILEKCTEEDARQSALQILSYSYDAKGEKEKAVQLARKGASLFTCRDNLLAQLLDGEEGLEHNRNYVRCLLDLMTVNMPKNDPLSSGKIRFTPEEQTLVYEKIVAIYDTMFENGDYGFYHDRLREIHHRLAEFYANLKQGEKTLFHLSKAAEHAVKFVDFSDCTEKNPYRFTSLLFRGQDHLGFSATRTENTAKASLNSLDYAGYDFVRDTHEFETIRRSLDEKAGNWHPKT